MPPLIPNSVPLEIFDDIPWNAWMNGVPIGNAPHTVPKGHCKIVCDHKSNYHHPIKYKTGMRGQIVDRKKIKVSGEEDQVKIFIKGVTDQGADRDKWVPRWLVTIGTGETARKTGGKNGGKAK